MEKRGLNNKKSNFLTMSNVIRLLLLCLVLCGGLLSILGSGEDLSSYVSFSNPAPYPGSAPSPPANVSATPGAGQVIIA